MQNTAGILENIFTVPYNVKHDPIIPLSSIYLREVKTDFIHSHQKLGITQYP